MPAFAWTHARTGEAWLEDLAALVLAQACDGDTHLATRLIAGQAQVSAHSEHDPDRDLDGAEAVVLLVRRRQHEGDRAALRLLHCEARPVLAHARDDLVDAGPG